MNRNISDNKPINLHEKIGVDPEKYSKEKTINDLSEFFELAISFTPTLLIYFIGSLIIFLSISVGYIFVNKTYVFPILFFVFSIPIILGASLIGFSRGLYKTVTGIDGILNYSVNLTEEIYEIAQRNNENKNIKASEIGRYVGYYVVLPAVKVWMNTKFLGGIIYSLVSKGFTTINDILDKQSNISEENGSKDAIKTKKIKSIIKSTTSISKKLVGSINTICQVISIISIIIGGILLTILIFSMIIAF